MAILPNALSRFKTGERVEVFLEEETSMMGDAMRTWSFWIKNWFGLVMVKTTIAFGLNHATMIALGGPGTMNRDIFF